MEYRAGKCSDCGAEYKIPSSFAHDVARCKECGGTVHIGKVGEPAPEAPAPEPKPVPARKVAPPAEKPKMEEHKPSGKKGSGPSMLEKLKAQREAGGAEEVAEEKPPARQPAAKKPAAPAARGAAKPAGKRGAPARRSSRRGGKEEGDEEEGGRTTRRAGRRRPEKKKKGLPVGGLLSVGGLLLLVGLFFIFKDDLLGAGESVKPTNVPPVDQTAEADPVDEPEEDPEDVPEEQPEETTEEAPEEQPEEQPKPEKPKGDPDSIDLLAIPDYGPAFGTTEEEWDKMNADMTEWLDPWGGGRAIRAKNRILEHKVKAMPVILNNFKTIDLSTEQGDILGKQFNRAIQDMLFGTNFGWKHPDQEPDDYLYFNKKVVQSWCTQWDRVLESGIEYWIKMGKMDEKGENNPAAKKEAARLRKLFGDAPAADDPSDFGGGDGMEDDMDID